MSASPAAPAEASDALDLGQIKGTLGVALRLAQLYVFERFYEDLRDAGVGPGEFTVLTAIGSNPGVRQGVLAAALSIKRSNMAKLATALQRRKLVERRVPPADRRAIQLFLTPSGEALLAAVAPRAARHDALASAGVLTAAERTTLIRLLRKLADGPVAPERN